eukprot:SAG31_NODE_4753_length_2977_cov_2.510076_2_plen_88_part_00
MRRGQELLIDYGTEFWNQAAFLRKMAKKLQADKAEIERLRQHLSAARAEIFYCKAAKEEALRKCAAAENALSTLSPHLARHTQVTDG